MVGSIVVETIAAIVWMPRRASKLTALYLYIVNYVKGVQVAGNAGDLMRVAVSMLKILNLSRSARMSFLYSYSL